VLHQFPDPGVGAEFSSTRDDDWRPTMAVKISGVSSAIGVKIVVAQNDDRVRFFQRIFDNPRFADDAKYWPARDVQNGAQHDDENERYQ
jgi:hypothetical protein